VVDDAELYQYDGMDAGQYAVYIPDVEELAGYPRHFNNIETSGRMFFDLGGSAGTFITNSYVGEVKFRANTRSVHITATRLGVNQITMMEVQGNNIVITGNNIGPSITLVGNTQAVTILANTYNGSVYDNSNTRYNSIEIPYREYVPTMTSTGSAPDLGNGTLHGYYSRIQHAVTLCMNLTFGTTTDLGNGGVSFSVPAEIAPINTYQATSIGSAFGIHYDNQALNAVGAMVVTPADNVATFLFTGGGSGGLAAAYPFTWADTDVLRGCVSYTR